MNKHYEEFISRLEKMGMIKGVHYIVSNGGSRNEFIFDVLSEPVQRQIANVEYDLKTHALMGLIYHFKNRGWIINDSYTFILKGTHGVTFASK